MAYHAVHALALKFTGSATPLDVHLTSFYTGVLPGLPTALAVIEGLGMRLYFIADKGLMCRLFFPQVERSLIKL